MCIIMIKPAGITATEEAGLTKELFRNMTTMNRDGNGVMIRYADRPDRIHIKKGFADGETARRWIIENSTNPADIVVYHARLSTHGNEKCVHPFPLKRRVDQLIRTEYFSKSAVAHNGIINGYGQSIKHNISDTMAYTKQVLAPLRDILHRPQAQSLIAGDIGAANKLAILDATHGLILIGTFITDEKTGLQFSNGGYNWEYLYNYDYESNKRWFGYERQAAHYPSRKERKRLAKKNKGNVTYSKAGEACDWCGAIEHKLTSMEGFKLCDPCIWINEETEEYNAETKVPKVSQKCFYCSEPVTGFVIWSDGVALCRECAIANGDIEEPRLCSTCGKAPATNNGSLCDECRNNIVFNE